MFDEDKKQSAPQDHSPASEPVDMFEGSTEVPAREQKENVSASESDGQEVNEIESDFHKTHSRRNMILVIIALVVLFMIIGAAVTYFVVFQKPSQTPPIPIVTPPVLEQETQPITTEEQPPQGFDQTQPVTSPEPPIENIPSPESSPDTDQDGVSDEVEAQYGSDSNVQDSDSDGLTDQEEIELYKTNPVDADSDADGFLDKQELDNGFDPNGPGKLPSEIPLQ